MAQATKKLRYEFRTKPFDHQRECFDLSAERAYYGYLMEQGTGKTWVGINTAGHLFERHRIEAVVVVAPNEGDLPVVWIEQFATHLPKRIEYTAVRARSGLMKVKEKKKLAIVLDRAMQCGLRIITTNVEATRKGSPLFDTLLKFMRTFKTLMIIDESTRIKGPSSSQTRGCLKLGDNADFRRIASGTLISNGGPLDAFAQIGFLSKDILGFESFTAYKAHYCELMPPTHGLVRHMAEKMSQKIRDPAKRAAFAGNMREIIQIPARDALGRVIYRNVAELHARIAPHTFRVLKDDCLDLPPKLYSKRFVDLTPLQRNIYDEVKEEVIAEFEADGVLNTITAPLAITRMLRLQQVICNHYAPDPDPDHPKSPPKRIEKWEVNKKDGSIILTNPRMMVVRSIIEEANDTARGIIWCRHHPEIEEVSQTLAALYGAETVVQLHGKIKDDARTKARHDFQNRKTPVRWLVGQIRAGIGIDLFEANWEIFYSNDYSYENRKQAEDRGHRIGLRHNLSIYDIVARGTGDEKIIDSLRCLQDISDAILGDHPRTWI